MIATQLTLFDIPKVEPKIERINWLAYSQRTWGWNPSVGGLAMIHETFAYNVNQLRLTYTAGMRVKIIRINEKWAIVEPTDKYIELCNAAGVDLAKEIYEVELISLGKDVYEQTRT